MRSSSVAARSAYDFMDSFLVDCPACGGLAVIRPTSPPARADNPVYDIESRARRLTCTACGKTLHQPATPLGQVNRPTMDLPLRLRAHTRHGDLIAFNLEHLDYLERYLAGTLRTETPDPRGWVRNASVVSRLPAWAKSAKNREEVLKAIAKARTKAAPGG